MGILRFDPVAEFSELPDHSRSSCLPRLCGDRGTVFLVTDSMVEDYGL
jgi:hypothetical protein